MRRDWVQWEKEMSGKRGRVERGERRERDKKGLGEEERNKQEAPPSSIYPMA